MCNVFEEVFLPAKYDFDTRLKIFIAWSFGRVHEFQKATAVALRSCTSDFEVEDWLPLPDRILGKQNISRRILFCDKQS